MVARLSSFLLLSAAATCLVANSEGSRPVSGLSTLKVSTSGRDTVAFDFGWRFRTGLHATAPVGEPPANTDPGVSPPESRPDYDASSWEAVALPMMDSSHRHLSILRPLVTELAPVDAAATRLSPDMFCGTGRRLRFQATGKARATGLTFRAPFAIQLYGSTASL